MSQRLLVVLLTLAGCDRAAPAEPPGVLMAALGQAKAYHHLADVQLADGRPDEAVRALEHILVIDFPAGSPDGEDALLDARARLGKVLIGLGRLDDAARAIDGGLVAGRRDSFFLANLYSVAGELHESRAKVAGADATAERHAAIAHYGRSIEINERIQKQLMEGRP